jgi:hypothetical protein
MADEVSKWSPPVPADAGAPEAARPLDIRLPPMTVLRRSSAWPASGPETSAAAEQGFEDRYRLLLCCRTGLEPSIGRR